MPRRQHAMQLIAVVAAIACADLDEGNASSSSEGGIETTAQAGSESTSDGGSSSEEASTSGDAPDDPNYPPPSPVGELGMCPSGFLGPITFDGQGWGCIPACDAEGLCPDGADGTPGECATNPASSATPCMSSDDCTIDGEMCGNAGMNRMGCLLPPSHCILRCEDGQPCPEPMTCAASVGVCQYVP